MRTSLVFAVAQQCITPLSVEFVALMLTADPRSNQISLFNDSHAARREFEAPGPEIRLALAYLFYLVHDAPSHPCVKAFGTQEPV